MKVSNRTISLLALTLITTVISNNVFSKNIEEKNYAKFTIVEGNIFIQKNKDKIKVKKGITVNPNDKIISGKNAKAEISFQDGSKLRIDKNTDVIISADSSIKDKYSFLKVLKGQVWASIKNKGEGRFAIKANKSVFAVMGTAFDVKSETDKTEMTVFDGSVGVTTNNNDAQLKDKIKDLKLEIDDNKNNSLQPHQIEKPVTTIDGPKQVSLEEWVEIVKNQTISIDNQGNATVTETEKISEDSWIKWNKELDSKQ